jgi:hypothetical protein
MFSAPGFPSPPDKNAFLAITREKEKTVVKNITNKCGSSTFVNMLTIIMQVKTNG